LSGTPAPAGAIGGHAAAVRAPRGDGAQPESGSAPHQLRRRARLQRPIAELALPIVAPTPGREIERERTAVSSTCRDGQETRFGRDRGGDGALGERPVADLAERVVAPTIRA